MTKADIVRIIGEKIGITAEKSTEIVDQLFATLKESLESGENIKISGFGNFNVRTKLPRKGRNPKTGEELMISGRTVVTFKPSALLRKALNENHGSEDQLPNEEGEADPEEVILHAPCTFHNGIMKS